MTTYTESLGLELPDTGDRAGTWGEMTNTNMKIIDRGVAGVKAITLSSTPHALTTTDGNLSDGQYKVLVLGGSPSGTVTINITPDNQDKFYFIVNNSGQSVVINQGSGSGATVTIPNGASDIVFADGAGTDAVVTSFLSKTLRTGNLIIPDGGNIGSSSDTNALGISSGGVVSVTATTANTSATDGALTVAGGLGVAADASIGDDLRLISDGAILSFGADSDVTFTHVADTGVLLNSTMAIQFNDASQYINAPSDAILDINATDEIELNATLVDVNANLDVSGTYTGGGLMTTGGNIVIPDAGNIGSASDTDAIAIASDGDVTVSQDLTVSGTATLNGNVDLGNATGDTITATGRFDSALNPSTNNARALGTSALRWSDLYVNDVYVGSSHDVNGILFVGTTTSVGGTSKCYFKFSGAGTRYGMSMRPNSAGHTYYIYLVNASNTFVGGISMDSDNSGVTFSQSSDYRLKENISDMTGAIDRVKALKPKRFNFKIDENKKIRDGFLAHEAQEVVPEAVTGEKDAMKDGEIAPQGIDQSKLVPLLTGALQEALAKIEVLEQKVAALEAK